MKLNQPEIIQILRKRAGMNQGQFGAKAFHTSVQKGRTKIKNIELGKQTPSEQDLENMAKVLGLPLSALIGEQEQAPSARSSQAVSELHPVLQSRFPGLDAYLDLLNKAATLDDSELIDHIAVKIVELLENRSSLAIVSQQ